MSIQTEINRINGEVSTQADLIAQIATALGRKTAGGVETCTVILEGATSSYRPLYYSYTYVTDSGEITSSSVQNTVSSNYVITLENVLCGSVVTVYWNSKGQSLYCEGLIGLTSNSNYFNPYLVQPELDGTSIVHNKDGGAV